MIGEIPTVRNMINILGTSMSIMSTERSFSAGLSSPWSVSKFAKTLEDQKDVWHYFNKSATSSMMFGGIMSLTLKSIWPIIGSATTILYYKNLYKSALDKASQNSIKSNIENKGLNKVIEETILKGSIEEIRSLSKYLESISSKASS